MDDTGDGAIVLARRGEAHDLSARDVRSRRVTEFNDVFLEREIGNVAEGSSTIKSSPARAMSNLSTESPSWVRKLLTADKSVVLRLAYET